MRKRKAESSSTSTQIKTHVGFREMASEEDWNAIHVKTQEMLISNAQHLYNNKTLLPLNGCDTSPIRADDMDPGYRQSSLFEHFKTEPGAECVHSPEVVKQKQEIISPSRLEQKCARCLSTKFSKLSKCHFCEKLFCTTCHGQCSGCLRGFCSLCSQVDYSDNVEEKLFCLACLSENK